MRRRPPPSELGRLAAPIARVADALWRRMHWWIGAMAVLYFVSGIARIRPGEVGVVLRWGEVMGGAHGSGLMFAWPRPVDEVVHVDVKRVRELKITTLGSSAAVGYSSLDPVTVGYALSGDHNIVHVEMIAHYQVSDPVAFALYGAQAEDVLRVEATAAMMRSLGELGVDKVLSEGRAELIARASRRTQEGLDAARSGIQLTSLEVTRLAPPAAVAGDFDSVQSAIIGATTQQKEAETYAAQAIPAAQAEADKEVQAANADGATELATAQGDADAFVALDREYRAQPAAVRERLYRDAVDRAIAAAQAVRWIPPPTGARYQDVHVDVPARELGAGGAAAPSGQRAAPPPGEGD